MGENMWVEFSADIPNRRTAQWWHTRGTLLLAAAAYSIAFPDSTPLNVNKKKRSPMGRFIQT